MGHRIASFDVLALGLAAALLAGCGGGIDGGAADPPGGASTGAEGDRAGAAGASGGPTSDRSGSQPGAQSGGPSSGAGDDGEPAGDSEPSGNDDDADGDASPGAPAGPPPGPELALPDAITTFYVSSSLGNDAWSGTLPEPNGGGTDGPKASFEAAIDLLNGAAPGTHVLMRSGDTWEPTAQVEVSSAVGTEQDPIVLASYGDGQQPRIVSQHALPTLVVRGNASGASAYLRVHDLHLTAATPLDDQVAIFTGESFHPDDPHHLTFSQLTVEGNGGGFIMYGHDHLLHGSRIANNPFGDGVYVKAQNVSFLYNEFEANGPPPPDTLIHSLYISGCDRVVFEHNHVHTATDGVKVRQTSNSVFRYNTFNGLEATGIHIGGDSHGGAINNRIESNLIYDSGSGIVVQEEAATQVEPNDGLVIANNILHSPRAGFVEYGAHLVVGDVPSQNVAVINNLLYNMVDEAGIHISNGGADILCANNIVGVFTGQSAYELNPNVQAGSNLEFTSAAAFEALNLVDPAGFDFAMTEASSALIDQGMDVSEYLSDDVSQNPRPAGAGFDIGPYEYTP